MSSRRIIVVGGGAAGFFAAITCAEAAPNAEVLVLEKGPQFLAKVRISGGGRCNVTHACFDPREFAAHYPRGDQAMIGVLQRFQAADTVAWFEARGLKLKRETDGRMFPVTDDSQAIVDCLLNAARNAGVKLRLNCGVERVAKLPDGRFEVIAATTRRRSGDSVERRQFEIMETAALFRDAATRSDETLVCDSLLLVTGGCRPAAAGHLAEALGHTLEPPVPSLFTFQVELPWLRFLAGVSVDDVEVSVAESKLRERGPLLITHSGVSGPVILRLSAWGARALHELDYRFPLQVNWLPQHSPEEIATAFNARRQSQAARLVVNAPVPPLSGRLWEQLVLVAGIQPRTRWAALARPEQHRLELQLQRTVLPVSGKSLNKDEFVTCGGVRLREVDFRKMESKLCPGLFFAGELLDVDGLTGGFNFQAAWSTGWIAGRAMAGVV